MSPGCPNFSTLLPNFESYDILEYKKGWQYFVLISLRFHSVSKYSCKCRRQESGKTLVRIGNELGKNWERSEEVTFEGNWKSMALSAACHLVDWRHTFQWLWSAFAHLFYEFKLKLFTPKLLLSVNTLFERRTLVLNNIEPADLVIGMANLCYPW